MTARRLILLGLIVPALLAARPAADGAAHLRAGDAAFASGDYAGAAAHYDRAAAAGDDPRLAAFNAAAARYHLAHGGDVRALAAAEQGYRCCLEPGDPRRARALFGLGNCLLLRAGGPRPDAAALRAAIDRYTLCQREPGCDAALVADARYNQARARLLLAQVAPTSPGAGDDPPAGDDTGKPEPDDPRNRNDASGEPGTEDGKPNVRRPHGPAGDRANGARADGLPMPGRGTLAPVPERPDAAPIAADAAAEHLEQATRKILDDLTAHRRGRARPASPTVRDW